MRHKFLLMKKVVVFIAIICFGKIASAQTDSIPTTGDTAMHKMKTHEGHKGAYVTLQGGVVMIVKEGKAMRLDKDKTLKDGTVVMVDGTVKNANGNSSKLKEGDKIYLDGTKGSATKDMN